MAERPNPFPRASRRRAHKIQNHINQHQNDFGLSTSIILESATVASDKGSTTLRVGAILHNTD